MKKYYFEKHSNIKKAVFVGSIASISLVLFRGNIGVSKSTQDSEFNSYSAKYLQVLDETDNDQFDEDFVETYRSGKYTIDGKTYGINELYLIITDDSVSHVVAGDEIDLITGEPLIGKRIKIICLRDTSLLYKMYEDGIIVDGNVHLDRVILKQYVDSWDGEKQYKVPELIAEREASEYLRKRR